MSLTPLTRLIFNGVWFQARSGTAPGAGGYVIDFDTLDGWRDPAEDDSFTTEHWSGDGDVLTGERLASRRIRIRGTITGTTPDAALDAIDELSGARRGTLRVEEVSRGLTREVTARRISLVTDKVTSEVYDFTLTLVADDPVRYGSGTRPLTNGTNAIPNAPAAEGGTDAYPTLTLTGPHSALTIQHPRGTFQLAALASGTRVLDFRNGDVWNGSNRVFDTYSGAWPVVRPGGSDWVVSGVGSGSATLARFEAWS